MYDTLLHPHIVSVELPWKQLKQHNFILTFLTKQVGHRYKWHCNLAAEQSVGAGIQMGLGIYGPALTHLTI
jgi:hypothetical protein